MSFRYESVESLRSIEVRLEKSEREELVRQARRFVDTFGFAGTIRQNSPDPDDVLFWLKRHDVDLIGGNDADTGASDLKLTFGFFPKRLQPAPSSEEVEPLMEALKLYLGKVPGIRISDRYPPSG